MRLYFGCDDIGGSSTAQTSPRRGAWSRRSGVDILIAPTDTPGELAPPAVHPDAPADDLRRRRGRRPPTRTRPRTSSSSTRTAPSGRPGSAPTRTTTLGWRRAVTVACTPDGCSSGAQAAAFDAEFCSLGGTIAKRIWSPATLTDYLDGRRSGSEPRRGRVVPRQLVPCNAQALAKTDPQLRGKTSPVRSSSPRTEPGRASTRSARVRQGSSLPARVSRCREPTRDPASRRAPGYRTDFRQAFPKIPTSLYGGSIDVRYYDAMAATLQALDAGARRPLRRRAAVHGRPREGDPRRAERADLAGLEAPRDRRPTTIWQLQGPKLKPVVIRTIPRVDATLRRLLQGERPAAEQSTPACVKRTPPPWAR